MSRRRCKCCGCTNFKGGNESYSLTLSSGVVVLADQMSFGLPNDGECNSINHFRFPIDATYLLDSEACAPGPLGSDDCPTKVCSPPVGQIRNWYFQDSLPGSYSTENCYIPGCYFGDPEYEGECCGQKHYAQYPPCTSFVPAWLSCLHGSFALSVGCFVNIDPSLGPVGPLARWTLRLYFYITNAFPASPLTAPLPCCWSNPIYDPVQPVAASFGFTGYGAIADGIPSLPSSWSGGGTACFGWSGPCNPCAGPPLGPPPCQNDACNPSGLSIYGTPFCVTTVTIPASAIFVS